MITQGFHLRTKYKCIKLIRRQTVSKVVSFNRQMRAIFFKVNFLPRNCTRNPIFVKSYFINRSQHLNSFLRQRKSDKMTICGHNKQAGLCTHSNIIRSRRSAVVKRVEHISIIALVNI